MISLFVHGDPAPKGSSRAMNGPAKGKPCDKCGRRDRGFPYVINANDRTKAWEKTIRGTARAAMTGKLPVNGAVKVDVVFFLARPKYHYVSGDRSKPLKKDSPVFHTKAPDADKLERTLLDGLTNICFGDDATVCSIQSLKLYGEVVGARVVITEMKIDEIRRRDEGELLRTIGRSDLVQESEESVCQPELF